MLSLDSPNWLGWNLLSGPDLVQASILTSDIAPVSVPTVLRKLHSTAIDYTPGDEDC